MTNEQEDWKLVKVTPVYSEHDMQAAMDIGQEDHDTLLAHAEASEAKVVKLQEALLGHTLQDSEGLIHDHECKVITWGPERGAHRCYCAEDIRPLLTATAHRATGADIMTTETDIQEAINQLAAMKKPCTCLWSSDPDVMPSCSICKGTGTVPMFPWARVTVPGTKAGGVTLTTAFTRPATLAEIDLEAVMVGENTWMLPLDGRWIGLNDIVTKNSIGPCMGDTPKAAAVLAVQAGVKALALTGVHHD